MTAPVRFDDLSTGRSFACPAPEAVLHATTADDVLPVLEEVQRATAAGRWAYGYLAYETAPGLDPDLVTHAPAPGDPPVAWFGVGGPPVAVPPVRPAAAPPVRPTSATSPTGCARGWSTLRTPCTPGWPRASPACSTPGWTSAPTWW